jgi:hypothetical protein
MATKTPKLEDVVIGSNIRRMRMLLGMPPKVRKAIIQLCQAVSETSNPTTEVTDGQEVNRQNA